jgi:hypothetical protein
MTEMISNTVSQVGTSLQITTLTDCWALELLGEAMYIHGLVPGVEDVDRIVSIDVPIDAT